MTIAVSISQASGSKFKHNKHGVLPVVLSALNGVLPENAGILDGTVAQRLGLVPGQQVVLNINFRGFYEFDGKKYPNYDYTLVTVLGRGFETMVAEKVVASMDFGFGMSQTPTPTSHRVPIQPELISDEDPEVIENVKAPEITAELVEEGAKPKK